jgi:hypothetical protein
LAYLDPHEGEELRLRNTKATLASFDSKLSDKPTPNNK